MTSDRLPRISVVMPARNAARFLDEAVDSVLAQSFTDLELVVVDDGSTDGTRAILDGYQRLDDRIVVVGAVGHGLVDALATGIAHARAGLIARHDADDRSHPERLQRQWEVMEAHPEVGILGSSVQVISELGRPLHVIRYPLADAVVRLTLRHAPAFAHGAVVVRRDLLIAAGGYSAAAHPAEDYELWCRLVARGARTANIDTPLYEYRVNQAGVTRTRPGDVVRAAREVGRAYARDLRSRPTWRELRAGIEEVATLVDGRSAAPAALRRASRSLAAAAPLWSRRSPRTAACCYLGALLAEDRYRRAIRRGGEA